MLSTLRSAFCLGLSLLCTDSALLTLAADRHGAVQVDHVIRGRVTDPQRLRPEDGTLMVGRRVGDGFSSQPVRVGPDGSFVTPPLGPATNVLEVIRTPNSPTKPATVVGFTLVSLGASDVSGVTVKVRRDTAITGSFRMESDNPQAVWPPHIVVNAYLALDRLPLLEGTVAEGCGGWEVRAAQCLRPSSRALWIYPCAWQQVVALAGRSRWRGHHKCAGGLQRA
jgi:hypothetical protein